MLAKINIILVTSSGAAKAVNEPLWTSVKVATVWSAMNVLEEPG